MTSKFVSKFRRSLSFPNPSPPPKPIKFRHLRSASLPSTSLPLISLLLHSLTSSPQPRASASLVDGLTRLRAVHDYLDDILQLPDTRHSLCQLPNYLDQVLEAFLRFVDVFGTFQGQILSLKQANSAALVALRRKDYSRVLIYLKDLKKVGKEMEQLVSTLRPTERCGEIADVDLGDIIGGVVKVTVSVSTLLLTGISVSLTQKTASLRGLRSPKQGGIEEFEQMRPEVLRSMREKGDEEARSMAMKRMQEMERCIGEIEICTERVLRSMREKGDEEARSMAMKRMQEMERCIGEIEICTERVFRSLINIRVSLLNVTSSTGV